MLHVVRPARRAPAPATDTADYRDRDNVDRDPGRHASVADLLTDGPLPEPERRAIGAHAAHAVACGDARAAVEPRHLVFGTDGDLWLVGRPQHPAADESIRVGEIAATVVRCAAGVRIDPHGEWDAATLQQLGCSTELAADIATILDERPPAMRVAGLLQRRDDRLPRPPGARAEIGPAIDLPSPAIAGLSPVGDRGATSAESGREQRGWRDWARGALG